MQQEPRGRSGNAVLASEAALLWSNAGILDDPTPPLNLRLEKLFERRGRRSLFLDRRHAEFSEAVDQGRVLQRLLQGVDERVDDRLRRIARRVHPIPGRDVEFWHTRFLLVMA